MDKIILQGLKFYGYHGCLAEERAQGQIFFIDLVLYLDLSRAGESDDLKDTVDYSAVFQVVQKIVEGKPWNLIEKVAAVIADTILTQFSVETVAVTIHKPQAPIPGTFRDACVTIERTGAHG